MVPWILNSLRVSALTSFVDSEKDGIVESEVVVVVVESESEVVVDVVDVDVLEVVVVDVVMRVMRSSIAPK